MTSSREAEVANRVGDAAILPPGLRIYAFGDIHGRFDLLEPLYGALRRDLAESPPAESIEIFLGDYVDRGPQSQEVVEWLATSPPASGRRICLMGNHEAMLLDGLADPRRMHSWLYNGGAETMRSYRVAPPPSFGPSHLDGARAALLSALPSTHRAFLEALPRSVEFGGYLFVHAGVNPARGLRDQDPDDLVWTREPFLSSSADFGKVVVHGHTPAERPEIRPNRINIDTGAVFTGRLTCLALEGSARRFFQTRGR